MYTATVQLTINQFVPMNGIYGTGQYINATIGAPMDTSPQPVPGMFTGDGQSITVTVPQGYQGIVQITHQLADKKYVLLGLAFKGTYGGAGRVEFPAIDILRDPTNSAITVTDSCNGNFTGVFDYVILVQEVKTANIGQIDPDIETEEEN